MTAFAAIIIALAVGVSIWLVIDLAMKRNAERDGLNEWAHRRKR
jgi:hypothetical protein